LGTLLAPSYLLQLPWLFNSRKFSNNPITFHPLLSCIGKYLRYISLYNPPNLMNVNLLTTYNEHLLIGVIEGGLFDTKVLRTTWYKIGTLACAMQQLPTCNTIPIFSLWSKGGHLHIAHDKVDPGWTKTVTGCSPSCTLLKWPVWVHLKINLWTIYSAKTCILQYFPVQLGGWKEEAKGTKSEYDTLKSGVEGGHNKWE